ncbi:uncharacterized protein LOC110704370 [Chenopodium quinoa]|uniref:uncharacterized protein LOC110704370 n=1 Tax=Chenopodium quinoa TaxID=63459 RepID=UPI000B77F533|nr:uncharacterized protein LOC110704370 [Chenopodium quinoa]
MLKKGIPRRYVTWLKICIGICQQLRGHVITRPIQDEVPWCMLFADDIVSVDETKDGVNAKLEQWRQRLESRGFKLSRSKTEYLVCRFGTQRGTSDEMVSLDGKELTMSKCFKYLTSIIQKNNGDIDQDVAHRIKSG